MPLDPIGTIATIHKTTARLTQAHTRPPNLEEFFEGLNSTLALRAPTETRVEFDRLDDRVEWSVDRLESLLGFVNERPNIPEIWSSSQKLD